MKQISSENRGEKQLPERVLQFGEGNFLRAFIDWMFFKMNEKGAFNGSVVVVQPLEQGLIDVLNEQDSLYTLYLRGIESGKTISQHELITSLSRGINPFSNWDAYLETARNPEMRFIVSNTTEAGIAYVETEYKEGVCHASFPAKLTSWLIERFRVFEGSKESGVVFMPCELINFNGTKLKECILKHAQDWDLGAEFVAWINDHCTFLNTLVDRIVPGYPREEVEAMTKELGYKDNLICAGEIFHLFVIEGPESLKEELPFHEAGLNVIWCEDMQPYRTRKVGVLNGAHTSSALAAYLGGLDTVTEMMNDEDFAPFIQKIVFEELVPVLPMDQDEAMAYAEAVMERFRNPFVRHEFLSISLNSVAKWKVRVLPSLKAYVEKTGKVPSLLAFSFAALVAFYKGDLRSGYEVKDDAEIVAYFKQVWTTSDAAVVCEQVMKKVDFWGEDLTEIEGLKEAVVSGVQQILDKGVRATIQNI